MKILCGLRPVDLVKNKRIGLVLLNGQVKRLHARFGPHQRQVLAGGLDKLRPALSTPWSVWSEAWCNTQDTAWEVVRN